jgi:hypothetical protein
MVLRSRLQGRGDIYVLYDLQAWLHNLHAMAERCGRTARQREFSLLATEAYASLQSSPTGNGRAWVCQGGGTCTDKNGLLGQEIPLISAQFLALAISVAVNLKRNDPGSASFVQDTVRIVVEHLERWASSSSIASIRNRISASPRDVRDGSSALFLSDTEVWEITIYSHLAGVLDRRPLLKSATLNEPLRKKFSEHLELLMQLLRTRTTVSEKLNSAGQKVVTAQIDAGFWRLYKDHRYAGYANSRKPVECKQDDPGNTRLEVSVPDSGVTIVPDLGWDFSHARRLVHLYDALEGNRTAIRRVFGVDTDGPRPADAARAFAKQIELKVWNGDKNSPLFANYLNGANGWYRVAYDNGMGRCVDGYPPYGLSDSFATGGFATWGPFNPTLRSLGERIYELMQSSDLEDQAFLAKHYPLFGPKASNNNRLLGEIMFLPTITGLQYQ